jgi:hypothetical protein
MVAMAGVSMLHDPPAVASLIPADDPAQTVEAPVIVTGFAFTVTVATL